MRLIASIAVFVPLLSSATMAKAEPGPVGRWLMETPATLWEFGLFRLQEQVFGWKGKHPLADTARGVHYDWDRNRITVSISVTKPISKQKCKNFLNEIRKSAWIYDGNPPAFAGYSTFANSFRRGFTNGTEPKDFLKKIDEIIRVEVSSKNASCEGRLVSKEVLYKE